MRAPRCSSRDSVSIRSTGTSRRAISSSSYSASVASSAASVILSARSARARGLLPAGGDQLALPDEAARLRPSQQLVAAEEHQVGARRDGIAHPRLARESPRRRGRAAVRSRHRAGRAVRVRAPGVASARWIRRRHEARLREVAAVHDEDGAGVGADRGFVVGGMRAIGGADLAEARAAPREDVGNAERSADLDQLAPADDDFLPGWPPWPARAPAPPPRCSPPARRRRR